MKTQVGYSVNNKTKVGYSIGGESMRDFKHLASSQLVVKKVKRDYTTRILSCIGAVIGLVCWIWFLNGLLS